jgi:SpoVK/Ycf46/Vps4 family AAA+-type ATPase
MSKQRKTTKPTTMPMALAYCCLSRVFRPFLRHQHATFLAVIVVTMTDMQACFEAAADMLLNGEPSFGMRRAGSVAHVEALKPGKRKHHEILQYAQNYGQIVLIFQDEQDVPPEFRASADVYEVVTSFNSDLAMGAVYLLCKEVISPADAEFMLAQPMEYLAAAFRKGRPPHRSLGVLRRSQEVTGKVNDRPPVREPPSTSLEDLVGYGQAKNWGLQLAKDLSMFQSGQLSWRDVDPGLLLSGPTGTGKTKFAQALANSCGIPLIHASAAIWQAEGHLGEMLAGMHRSFKLATEQAPCILLIDEFDSLGNRAEFRGEYKDYGRQVVNAALECLDGAISRPGVIVIGTTNYPRNVDAAFLRPGRLDKHISISLPDADERVAILQSYLGRPISGEQVKDIALATEDWSGAQLEQLARNARRFARDAGREPSTLDVIRAMPETAAVSQERLSAAAYHECGHAVVGLVAGRKIAMIKIADRYNVDAARIELGGVRFLHERDSRRTREWYLNEICVLFGGVAAEVEIFGAHDDGAGGLPEADLPQATRLATLAEGVFAMGGSLVSSIAHDEDELSLLRMRNPELYLRVDELLNSQMARARHILQVNRPILDALARTLLEKMRMTGDELSNFLRDNPHKITRGDDDELPVVRGARH